MLTQVETSGPGSTGLAPSRPQGNIALVIAASNHSILSILLLWKNLLRVQLPVLRCEDLNNKRAQW